MEKRLRTEIYTFLLHFLSLRSTLVAAMVSKDQMPYLLPADSTLSMEERPTQRIIFAYSSINVSDLLKSGMLDYQNTVHNRVLQVLSGIY